MNKKTKMRLFIISVNLLGVIMFFTFRYYNLKSDEERNDTIVQQSTFDGVLFDKYVNDKAVNHPYVFVVRNFDKKDIRFSIYKRDSLYNFFNIGDTIKKEKNSTRFFNVSKGKYIDY